MFRKVLLAALLALVLAGGWALAAGELPAQAAKVHAQFLEELDNGAFGQSYALALPRLKEEYNEYRWRTKMRMVRQNMGLLAQRSAPAVERLANYADLGEGEYLRFVHQVDFEKQHAAQETIVLARSGDGYYVTDYQIDYNKWPEAIKLIVNGLFLVFFIMGLLALITWAIGKFSQRMGKNKKEKEA